MLLDRDIHLVGILFPSEVTPDGLSLLPCIEVSPVKDTHDSLTQTPKVQDDLLPTGDVHLGKRTKYPKNYDPSILTFIPRADSRQRLGLIDGNLPFNGYDSWTLYEVSYLKETGLPVAALGEIVIPCTSGFLVESKSLKLYLNSLNYQSFSSGDEVSHVIRRDLASGLAIPEDEVRISIRPLQPGQSSELEPWEPCSDIGGYLCLEQAQPDTVISTFEYDPDLLNLADGVTETEEKLATHLLKSNCPVTGQPDWATLFIKYAGRRIDPASLLRYVVSFRDHSGFHEMCVERIFTDIMRRCRPEKLTVFARYTRRGGIDINPFRSNFENFHDAPRTLRQ